MRNLRGTLVGGCTVTLVVRAPAPLPLGTLFTTNYRLEQVMFVCLLQNIVARSPLIFLSLAEVR